MVTVNPSQNVTLWHLSVVIRYPGSYLVIISLNHSVTLSFSLHDCLHHNNLKNIILKLSNEYLLKIWNHLIYTSLFSQFIVAWADSVHGRGCTKKCRQVTFYPAQQNSRRLLVCWSQISRALIRSPFHPSDLSLISNDHQPQPLDWLTHEPRISTGLHERFSSAMWEFCKAEIRLIWTLCFWCSPQHRATCRLMSMSKNCISN